MSKLKSLIKKANTLSKVGVEPYEEGKKNFDHPTPCIEIIAQKRTAICKGCEFFKTEPIEYFRVTDETIPELSNKYCEDCGCISSYKLRQNQDLCNKWLE